MCTLESHLAPLKQGSPTLLQERVDLDVGYLTVQRSRDWGNTSGRAFRQSELRRKQAVVRRAMPEEFHCRGWETRPTAPDEEVPAYGRSTANPPTRRGRDGRCSDETGSATGPDGVSRNCSEAHGRVPLCQTGGGTRRFDPVVGLAKTDWSPDTPDGVVESVPTYSVSTDAPRRGCGQSMRRLLFTLTSMRVHEGP